MHCASLSGLNIESKKCMEGVEHCLVLLTEKHPSSALHEPTVAEYKQQPHGCWSWTELTHLCPDTPGICHIVQSVDHDSQHSCCCRGNLCNNSTLVYGYNLDESSLLRTATPVAVPFHDSKPNHPMDYFVTIVLPLLACVLGLSIIGLFYLLYSSIRFFKKSTPTSTQSTYSENVPQTTTTSFRWKDCYPAFIRRRLHALADTNEDFPRCEDQPLITKKPMTKCLANGDLRKQNPKSALSEYGYTLECLVNQYVIEQCVKDQLIDSSRFTQVWLAHLKRQTMHDSVEFLMKLRTYYDPLGDKTLLANVEKFRWDDLNQQLKSAVQNGSCDDACSDQLHRNKSNAIKRNHVLPHTATKSEIIAHLFEASTKTRDNLPYTNEDTMEPVAIKIFPPNCHKSWTTELSVFRALQSDCTVDLRTTLASAAPGSEGKDSVQGWQTSNIIRMLAFGVLKDQTSNLIKEYQLLMQYASGGNLSDRLNEGDSISISQALNWSENIANGLTYLHSENSPTSTSTVLQLVEWKPPIAHRDMKPRNILIRADGSACLSDFGQAVVLDSCLYGSDSVILTESGVPTTNTTTVLSVDAPIESMPKAGTLRYMAPEVLDGAINFSSTALLRTDIYPLGLILWELLSAISIDQPETGNFNAATPKRRHWLPYEYELGHQCSFPLVLHHWVCLEKRRPACNPSWLENLFLAQLYRTIAECWDPDPEARLTANCVLERMVSLKAMVLCSELS